MSTSVDSFPGYEAHVERGSYVGQARVRVQAAWVRTLLDEVSRYALDDRRAVRLRDQIHEEVAQLARLEEAEAKET